MGWQVVYEECFFVGFGYQFVVDLIGYEDIVVVCFVFLVYGYLGVGYDVIGIGNCVVDVMCQYQFGVFVVGLVEEVVIWF